MFINKPDILLLTETWLVDDISNNELNLNGYFVYRTDRRQDTDGVTTRGGGVLMAVSKSLKSSRITPNNDISRWSRAEELFVKISANEFKFIFGVIYIPPNSEIDLYYYHVKNVELIKNKRKDHKIVLRGDYNLPKTF